MSQEPMQTTPPEEPRDLGQQIRLWGTVVAGAVLAIFFLSNLHEVEVKFLFIEEPIALIWALIISAGLGAVGMFLGQALWNRRRGQSKQEKP